MRQALTALEAIGEIEVYVTQTATERSWTVRFYPVFTSPPFFD